MDIHEPEKELNGEDLIFLNTQQYGPDNELRIVLSHCQPIVTRKDICA